MISNCRYQWYRWRGGGGCQESSGETQSCGRQATTMDWIRNLQETGCWLLEPRQPTPNNLYSLRALRATTTGAPLLQGDALVAYENMKWEKSCLGKGNESEINWEMNELNVWCKGKLRDTWLPEMGTNCPQWHWTSAVGCEGGTDFAIAQSDGVGCVNVATSIGTGTLMTGLFGPIPCGCQTISKCEWEQEQVVAGQ